MTTESESLGPLGSRPFEELLREAVTFHGHLCPGQVLGVRMALAGCRELGFENPRQAGKRLVVFVEIDRCAADAIEALTGVSFGKRTLKHVDFGKAAATFVDTVTGEAVRVVARDDARQLAGLMVPEQRDARRAQTEAYRTMSEARLLRIVRVTVDPDRLERRRVRVACGQCGEGVNYAREVRRGGRTLCRACAGDSYYALSGL